MKKRLFKIVRKLKKLKICFNFEADIVGVEVLKPSGVYIFNDSNFLYFYSPIEKKFLLKLTHAEGLYPYIGASKSQRQSEDNVVIFDLDSIDEKNSEHSNLDTFNIPQLYMQGSFFEAKDTDMSLCLFIWFLKQLDTGTILFDRDKVISGLLKSDALKKFETTIRAAFKHYLKKCAQEVAKPTLD